MQEIVGWILDKYWTKVKLSTKMTWKFRNQTTVLIKPRLNDHNPRLYFLSYKYCTIESLYFYFILFFFRFRLSDDLFVSVKKPIIILPLRTVNQIWEKIVLMPEQKDMNNFQSVCIKVAFQSLCFCVFIVAWTFRLLFVALI